MIIENFVKDPEKLAKMQAAIAILHEINAFGLLLEISADRAETKEVANESLQSAAMRGVWREGYYQCLRDVADFMPRFVLKKQDQRTPSRASAVAKTLLEQEVIDKEEYGRLTSNS